MTPTQRPPLTEAESTVKLVSRRSQRLGTTVLQRERDRLKTIELMRQVCRGVSELRIKAANIVGQRTLDDLQAAAVIALAHDERDGRDESESADDSEG